MELKKTLLMPKTNFEMRGNLNIKEPQYVANWLSSNLYEKMLENRLGAESYVLHDGPPYANGNIHCGHMLNRLLKDFVVRYKNMSGFYTPFIFGWDTHGLPIENEVIKSGVNRKTTPRAEFRRLCEAYAIKQVEKQKEQIKRLGVLGDYDAPYLTLSHEFEARQIEVFKTMALKGLIFRGLKPVYWSPSSESALAESEIEYYDVTSWSIYVAFQIRDGKGLLDNDVKAVIWTTTPWTLPANLAISLHPDFTYGVFETEKGKFLFLSKFKDNLVSEFGFEKCELLKEYKGSELEGITTTHPFYDRESIFIVGTHVTDEAGTGLVHTAPGHGMEDYVVCAKYGIKPYCPVDSKGYMTEDAGEDLAGIFYEDANKIVLEKLTNNNALLKASQFVHSYPHDWRSKKPLIFRATPQWFCSIEPEKEKILEQIKNIKWYPKWGETRMNNMIKERADWCISRQRVWGVPIPIIYCEDNTPIMDEKVFDHIANLFREHGSNIWYEKDAKELLPNGYANEHSPHGEFTKELDIMDVWFDSGSSWNGVLKERGLNYPSDLYLEGNDQYRGWFNSSIILSTAMTGESAFKTCVTHGFVVDENWDKMSKSKGNGIDPSKVANMFGADILRLWAATVDFSEDVRISEGIIKQVSEVYRKVRNTFKFLLGNLSNGEDKAPFNNELDHANTFEQIDKYILARLELVKNHTIEYFNEFNFANAMSEIVTFMSTDLSSFYLDVNKDVLYCEKVDSLRRKQVQTVLYEVTYTLMRLLTPILPFTMDEVNKNLPNASKECSQLYDYPIKTKLFDESLLEEYKSFKEIRDVVLKSLEEARKNNLIGSPQEANVQLSVTTEDLYNLLKGFDKSELNRLFVVSNIEVLKGNELIATVSKHAGHKCPRCWNYVDTLYEIEGEHVCERCYNALKGE